VRENVIFRLSMFHYCSIHSIHSWDLLTDSCTSILSNHYCNIGSTVAIGRQGSTVYSTSTTNDYKSFHRADYPRMTLIALDRPVEREGDRFREFVFPRIQCQLRGYSKLIESDDENPWARAHFCQVRLSRLSSGKGSTTIPSPRGYMQDPGQPVT
jgi:hypothetical protein